MAEEVLKRITFNCSALTNDNLLSISEFQEYLQGRIKVNGKRNNLKNSIELKTKKDNIILESKVPFKKVYLKFLAKKFLHSKELRDWVRVVAEKDGGYAFVYYNVRNEEEEEE